MRYQKGASSGLTHRWDFPQESAVILIHIQFGVFVCKLSVLRGILWSQTPILLFCCQAKKKNMKGNYYCHKTWLCNRHWRVLCSTDLEISVFIKLSVQILLWFARVLDPMARHCSGQCEVLVTKQALRTSLDESQILGLAGGWRGDGILFTV